MGEGDGEMGGATKNTGTDYSRRRDNYSLSHAALCRTRASTSLTEVVDR